MGTDFDKMEQVVLLNLNVTYFLQQSLNTWASLLLALNSDVTAYCNSDPAAKEMVSKGPEEAPKTTSL